MALNSQKLQAHYLRRREQQERQMQKTTALSRYYDNWNKVTTRYNSWTTPEFYEQANEQHENMKKQKERAAKLAERREKLLALLNEEKKQYELEERNLSRPGSRRRQLDTKTLLKIEEEVKERENIKRKLELEARLYGKWRHGVDDENMLYSSRSDHEALAKLNWMNKRVEEHMQREQEEKEAQDRQLQLQKEIAKIESTQKERQLIREQEIKEIKALQERHMEELKQCQKETDELKQQEDMLNLFAEELKKEMDVLKESSALIIEPPELSHGFNLNKIKLTLRRRSEEFREHIKLCLGMLERMSIYAFKNDTLVSLKEKYTESLEKENALVSAIDSLYESEAKQSLHTWEEKWMEKHMQRYKELKDLILAEQINIKKKIESNQQQQKNIVEMRSAHLASIENSNEKIKELKFEQELSPRQSAMNFADSEVKNDTNSAHKNFSTNSPRSIIPTQNSEGVYEAINGSMPLNSAQNNAKSYDSLSSNSKSVNFKSSGSIDSKSLDSKSTNLTYTYNSRSILPSNDSNGVYYAVNGSMPINSKASKAENLRSVVPSSMSLNNSRAVLPSNTSNDIYAAINGSMPGQKVSSVSKYNFPSSKKDYMCTKSAKVPNQEFGTLPSAASLSALEKSRITPEESTSISPREQDSIAQRSAEVLTSNSDTSLTTKRSGILPTMQITPSKSIEGSHSISAFKPGYPTQLNNQPGAAVSGRRTYQDVSNSFRNLNLNAEKKMPPTTTSDDNRSGLVSRRSKSISSPETVDHPKFARKRVVWS